MDGDIKGIFSGVSRQQGQENNHDQDCQSCFHRSSPEESLWFHHQNHSHDQEYQEELEDREEENAISAEGSHNDGPDKSALEISPVPRSP